jgi:6-phosphogluconolactonase (cycloisomerase 2 family)
VDPSTGKLTDMGTVCACVGNSGFGSGHIAFNAKGTVLFQAIGGETADGVALYSINQSTGALTSLSKLFLPIVSNGVPSFALDSSGTFLYAAGFLRDEILGLSITDAGAFTALPGFPLEQTGSEDQLFTIFIVNFKP